MQTYLHLFGTPYLEKNGEKIPLRTKKQQRWIALLAYLATKQKPIHRQRLANLIWGDVTDSLDRLRKHTLDELKRKLGSDLLEVDSEAVSLSSDLWVDVNYFRKSLTEYRLCAASQKDVQTCIQELEKAIAVYTGDFLGDYSLPESEDFYWWQIDLANTLHQDFCDAIEEAIVYFYDEIDKAMFYANLWKSHDPDNLKVHAWILLLLEISRTHTEVITYRKQLVPLLEKWQNSNDDLDGLIREIQTRLEVFRARHDARYQDTKQLSTLLSNQLNSSELSQAKNDPPFFEGYLSILSELAASNPLEAVNAASEIATILFDLKDNPEDAKTVLDNVETMLNKTGVNFAREIQFQLLLQRLNIYRALGLSVETVELLKNAADDQDYIESLGDNLKAAWYCNRGLIECWVIGDYENALKSLFLAKKYFRLGGQIKAEAGVTADIGLIYWNQGQLLRAEEFLSNAKEQLSLAGNYPGLIKTIGNLGMVYLYQGRLNEAYAFIQEHFQLANHFGHLKEIRRARGNRGITKFHLGDYEGAIEDLEASRNAVRAVNESKLHATVNLSRCYNVNGDPIYAYELASWALAQAQEKRYLNIEIIARRALAECVSSQEAYEILQQALKIAENKRRIDEAACLISLSKLSSVQNEQEEYWQKGARILREMGAQAWLENGSLQLPTL